MFMGYLNLPEKTVETADKEGLLHTGDLAKVDKDGFIYITGTMLRGILGGCFCLTSGHTLGSEYLALMQDIGSNT